MPLHPDFPIVEGRIQMTQEWVVQLPSKFNRRIEEGNLVFWQPGMTAWITVWGNNDKESEDAWLNGLIGRRSPDATSSEVLRNQGVLYYTYRLAEPDKKAPALYCFARGKTSYVQMAVYFDKEQDSAVAKHICTSLSYAP